MSAIFDKGIKITNSEDATAQKVTVQSADGTLGYQSNLTFEKLSTGLLTGGIITINADTTKYNVSATTGLVSNFSNPNLPVFKTVNYAGITGKVSAYLATSNITYIGLDENGVLLEQSTPFTTSQDRDIISLGAVIHSNRTNINTVNNIGLPTVGASNQLHDLMEAIGALNLSGNKFSANGANLKLNKSAGVLFKLGSNAQNDWKNPHQISQGATTALTFRYRTQTGVEGLDITDLDPSKYDLDGVLTTVPPNKYTVQTITLFQAGAVRIQYGQNIYNSLDEAEKAIVTRSFVAESNIAQNGVNRGYVIMKHNTSSLQNTSDAKLIEITKFGGLSSGGLALTFTNITAALGYTPEDISNKQDSLATDGTGAKFPTVDAVNGGLNTKADLVGGFVPQSQLPSYVDDVLEFANFAGFPATGETGKICIAIDTSKQYRWSGSAYVQITNGLIASTADVPENVSFLYFTAARVLATLLSGISFATGGAVVSTDSILVAMGKLQKQINDNLLAIGLKANDNNTVHISGTETITGAKTFSPVIPAVAGISRPFYLKPTLNAVADNDFLYGYTFEPTFNTNGFNGVKRLLTTILNGGTFQLNGSSGNFEIASTGTEAYFSSAGQNFINANSSGGSMTIRASSYVGLGSPTISYLRVSTSSTGNVLIQNGGSFTDDGINRLQVSGSIAVSTNINSSTNNLILSDTNGVAFRTIRALSWADNVNARFFQIGTPSENVAFTTQGGNNAARMSFFTNAAQFSSGGYLATTPAVGVFEVCNATAKFFNIFSTGNTTIGSPTDNNVDKLQVTGSVKATSSVQVGDNVATASASNVGAIRYRTSGNNSYAEMCMQTGASTYAWTTIVEYNW